MSEQSGRSESSDRQPRSGRNGTDRQQPRDPVNDLVGDLQRWLIRSSAKNMRRELEDQVRRTIGGQRQAKGGDVWDVATTEIPPEVGEAPECQWCPICRAARRMRDTGPGLAGPLSGAGEAVATVMQDAIGALDSLLARAGGRGATDGGDPAARRSGPDRSGRSGPAEPEPGPATRSSAAQPAQPPAAPPDSLAGEHGQAGRKPGDRLATAAGADADTWAAATTADPADDGAEPGSASKESEGPDWRGHGPGDRS
ncbi:MAG TPA: hypothetical protein VEJ42_11300 [Streptosporangiaceae bacterium]|nr:hypothetical protein [Streptosporangiaceae bacterium]